MSLFSGWGSHKGKSSTTFISQEREAARSLELVQDQPQPPPSLRGLSSFRIRVCGSSVRQKGAQCKSKTNQGEGTRRGCRKVPGSQVWGYTTAARIFSLQVGGRLGNFYPFFLKSQQIKVCSTKVPSRELMSLLGFLTGA